MNSHMSKTVLRGFVLAFLLTVPLVPSAQAKEAAANQPAAASQVRIGNFTFTPAEIAVAPGTTVTWINEDDIPHLVAATGSAFRSKALDTDQQYSFTFTAAGTYEYFCGLHPHMQGKVIVK
jgi:amicyanin